MYKKFIKNNKKWTGRYILPQPKKRKKRKNGLNKLNVYCRGTPKKEEEWVE